MFTFVDIFVFQESLESFFRTWNDIVMHKAVVEMALGLADHPQTLADIICDRLATHAAREYKLRVEDMLEDLEVQTDMMPTSTVEKSSPLFIHHMLRDFTGLTAEMAKTADFDICSNKHIRAIDDFTQATPFSTSRIIVFRSLNLVMCQLDPDSKSKYVGTQRKEWHIEVSGAQDTLLMNLGKVFHWFEQYEPVSVRSLWSRSVVLKVVERGIGTGMSSRKADCWLGAYYDADGLLNVLNLIAEIKKQQNLEISITKLNIHNVQIKDAALTELLLSTLKFGTNTVAITISNCEVADLVFEHIRQQLPTCDKLELIDFNSSPCMTASLGNVISFTSLKKLNLQRCITTPQVADQIAQILPRCCNLMYLYLGFNKTAGLIEKLFGQHNVSRFHFLQNLNLQEANLSQADLSSLSEAVGGGGLPQLQTLKLSGNVLVNCMADLLGSNVYRIFAYLEYLDLCRTSLNRDDLLRLSAAVQHGQFPKLSRLSLAHNNLEVMEDAVTSLIKNCIEQYENRLRLDLFMTGSIDLSTMKLYHSPFENRMKSLCLQTNVEICHYLPFTARVHSMTGR